MPSLKFLHVSAKVLETHLVIDAVVFPLEYRPERFDTIGVRDPVQVLPRAVLHGVVLKVHHAPVVALPLADAAAFAASA